MKIYYKPCVCVVLIIYHGKLFYLWFYFYYVRVCYLILDALKIHSELHNCQYSYQKRFQIVSCKVTIIHQSTNVNNKSTTKYNNESGTHLVSFKTFQPLSYLSLPFNRSISNWAKFCQENLHWNPFIIQLFTYHATMLNRLLTIVSLYSLYSIMKFQR